MKRIEERIFKALASLKLAVIIIIALGVLTAIGTFTEAKYDELTAKKLVYQSPYMIATMMALAINLLAVMVDRWPWKRHHTGFVLAHVGIIMILGGAWMTQKFGVDGTLRLEMGGRNRYVSVQNTDVVVYATFDGDNYKPIARQEVDFLVDPPTTDKPLVLSLPDGDVRFTDYYPYAQETRKYALSENPKDGPAVRFQLQNDRVNVTEWLHSRAAGRMEVMNLGPAQVVLTREPYTPSGQNEIVLTPRSEKVLHYTFYSKDGKKLKSGEVEAGGNVDTPWMGLVFRAIDYLPHATQEVKYSELERPAEGTTSAVKFSFNGRDEWVGKNGMVRLFTDKMAYIVTYQNRLLDLNFELFLKDFQVGRYQGTMRAASYASRVEVPEMGEVIISMNDPLKYKGYTFYQASFEEDEKGQPKASILSVNFDPGRMVKYLGSLMIVVGSIVMFYFKRRKARQKAKDLIQEAV